MAEQEEHGGQLDGAEGEVWQRTFAQMWEIAFAPELERRRDAGLLDDQFQLYIAQLLQPPDADQIVLFNEEVRGDFLIRVGRDVKEGETGYIGDLKNAEQYELPDDLLDCGHFTIIRDGEKWQMTFNFLSGRSKARSMIELAHQFYESAVASTDKGHVGPAIDNLFSCCELISKAELILHRSPAAKTKKHAAVKSHINAWARLGNIDASFVRLFNRLGEQRSIARYADKKQSCSTPSIDELELVEAMIARGLERAAKSIDVTAQGS